ncbi:MAG TPA: NUDIX domain-containing protein [Ensifer sp.]|jgi:8-oxo-dGTP pyrophosphatase MutT (NUDIX family)|uniref:NUDIX hydrolase n=1 Tax=Ensifer sp. TaxID=1872086 RepID=UPI002E15B847|nr:NUDIX domain-containing protein [Ensifer sp.]
MKPDAHKVLIYATWQGRLLLFDEPDFPEIEIQVPGGTMEPGESPEQAAAREFTEETGLTSPQALTHLVTQDYHYKKDERTVCHRRHYFHVALGEEQQESWTHQEMTPFGGGEPIRFRFFWLEIEEARSRLGYGMQDALDFLEARCICPSP